MLVKTSKLATAALAAIAAIGLSASIASAFTLVDYKPGPVSPNLPEFTFSGPVGAPFFRTGPGAVGNGDGILSPANQTAGGLDAETPFIINGVPGSQVDFNAGTTLFWDTTLTFLNGFTANAPAVNLNSPNPAGPFFQSLAGGNFELRSTTGLLLLAGNVSTASFISGSNGGGSGSGAEFNAGGVNYTGGLIFNALVTQAGAAAALGNGMSIAMTDVLPQFAIDPADGFLRDFNANGTGLFNTNIVPEPATIGLVALSGIGLLSRRRRA